MKAKINLSLPLLVMLAGSVIAADGPPAALTTAVYDFTGEGGAAGYGGKVTALVTASLTTHTNLIMLERAALNKALSEQAFGISGLVSSDAAAAIGAITGAKVLVSGQVILTEQHRLVIVASIIGTETGRLFAAKAEDTPDRLLELTADLGSKIAETITNQATNLIAPAKESRAGRMDRIVKSISGTNRPSVSVNIFWPAGGPRHRTLAELEFGAVLLKAGFPVVDSTSERKPEVEIKGVGDFSNGPRGGKLFSALTVIELRVQERRTGDLIVFDRQESMATADTGVGAEWTAQIQAADELAGRILPLLAE